MKSAPAIAFIHNGASWFLPFALQQARHASPGSEVFLLGDAPGSPGVKSRSLNQDLAMAERFRSVYCHLSTNSYGYELFCYLRWFQLLDFMEREGLEEICYFDSDVLLYSPCEVLKARVVEAGKHCGLLYPEHQKNALVTAGGHASYWQREILEQFCESCIALYEDSARMAELKRLVQDCRENGISGGICDMTALSIFATANPSAVHNFAAILGGGAVDNNMAESANFVADEYEMNGPLKRVDFVDGMPMMRSKACGAVVAHALHFQGPRKKLMPQYYTGGAFPGRRRAEARLALRAAPKRFRNWLLRRN